MALPSKSRNVNAYVRARLEVVLFRVAAQEAEGRAGAALGALTGGQKAEATRILNDAALCAAYKLKRKA